MSTGFIPHDRDLRPWVDRALDAAGLPQSHSPERQQRGIANHVYRSGDFLVRLGTGSDARCFEQTASILKALHGQVPCQRLVFADLTREVLPVPFMICEWASGQPLGDLWSSLSFDEKCEHVEKIPSSLKSLHEFEWRSIDCFADMPPWPERQRLAMQEVLARARADSDLDQAIVTALEDYWNEHVHLLDSAGAPALLHNDVNPGNVIFDGSEVSAFVDFDDAIVGPTEIEYWCMCDEFMHERALSMQEFKTLLAPWYRFDAPGSLERRKLNEALETMEALTATYSWRSRRTTLARAMEEYEFCFVEDGYRTWFG